MDIQKAQFLNGNTPIGWVICTSDRGSGNENWMGQESLCFRKVDFRPHERWYSFKLLRWPIAPEGRRGTIMEKKKTPQTAVAPSRNQCRSEKAVVGRLYMPQKYGSLAFVVEEMGPMDMRHSLEGAMD